MPKKNHSLEGADNLEIIIEADYKSLSSQAARRAAAFIRANPESLLCFAAGDTPLGMFEELLKMQKQNKVNLSSVFYAGLDEWLGLGYQDKGSCRQVMFDNYYTPAGIPAGRIAVFDGMDKDAAAQCRKMEQWIALRGGIGLAVLGIGLNGHIGFNEPNAPVEEGCFTVELDEVTKTVSKKYFNKTLPVQRGVTIGWKTLSGAKKIILLASGAKKAHIVEAAFTCEKNPAVPASLLQDHPDFTVILDKPAAGERSAVSGQ
jgi:glucosamine-6-phosphate deaminase